MRDGTPSRAGHPGQHRHLGPHFGHHADLLVLTQPGVTMTVIMGQLGDTVSPAQVFSPLVGAGISLGAGAETRLPLIPD